MFTVLTERNNYIGKNSVHSYKGCLLGHSNFQISGIFKFSLMRNTTVNLLESKKQQVNNYMIRLLL